MAIDRGEPDSSMLGALDGRCELSYDLEGPARRHPDRVALREQHKAIGAGGPVCFQVLERDAILRG
jgi:hypothetical protein